MLFLSLVIAIVGSTALIEAVSIPKENEAVVEPGRKEVEKHINEHSDYKVKEITVETADLKMPEGDIQNPTLTLITNVVVEAKGEFKKLNCTTNLNYLHTQTEYTVQENDCGDPKLNYKKS